jgi:hypothetical protein
MAGPRGSGKSEPLKDIERRCRRLPHAWFDFEARPEVANALAWYADGEDVYDRLLRLNQQSGPDADLVLCQAFFADLVAAYKARLYAQRGLYYGGWPILPDRRGDPGGD